MSQHFYKCPRCGYEAPRVPYEYSGYLKPHLAEILAMLSEGSSADDIASVLNLEYPAYSTINYIRRRYGIEPPQGDRGLEDRNNEIITAHAAGVSIGAIAGKHGISTTRAREIIERGAQRNARISESERVWAAATSVEDLPIAVLPLPTRVRNAFFYLDCKTIGDVMRLGESALARQPNFGKVSLAIWQECLQNARHQFEARR